MKLGDMEVSVFHKDDDDYVAWEDVKLALGSEATEKLKSWLGITECDTVGVPVDVLRMFTRKGKRL